MIKPPDEDQVDALCLPQELTKINSFYLQIDRKNKFSYVPQLRFILPDHKAYHNDTIVDGELVTDTEPDGRQVVRFLAFDMLACHGLNLISKPLTSRLGVSRPGVYLLACRFGVQF